MAIEIYPQYLVAYKLRENTKPTIGDYQGAIEDIRTMNNAGRFGVRRIAGTPKRPNAEYANWADEAISVRVLRVQYQSSAIFLEKHK